MTAVLSLAVFMSSLDLFIVNLAFPYIGREYAGTSLSSLSWVLNGYTIVFAAVLVPAGRWADRVGRRRIFTAGLVVFGFGSLLCGLAPGVAALIVVNALKASPWGTFTIAMTMPIALLMGVYLRRIRPGKVLEVSAVGFVLVLAAIWGGQYISQNEAMAKLFTFSAPSLAILIMVYGFAASALPVWLLLAPRDYLSTFVKLGTIALLAVGIVALHPTLHMPALTRFVDGSGPVFAGKIFPFAFITIACGA